MADRNSARQERDADSALPAGEPESVRRTFYLSSGTIDRLRGYIGWAQYRGPEGLPMQMSEFVDQAIAERLTAFEREYNKGKPFPLPRGKLHPGRLPRS